MAALYCMENELKEFDDSLANPSDHRSYRLEVGKGREVRYPIEMMLSVMGTASSRLELEV